MALSEWPDKFKRDSGHEPHDFVTATFEESMCVRVVSEKAIGLSDSELSVVPIEFWIPKSQVGGILPKRGEWIDLIEIPRWLADEKGLEYDE